MAFEPSKVINVQNVWFSQTAEQKYSEFCPICKDMISGYHYGVPTCESCKAFFKRIVISDKKWKCIFGNGKCRQNIYTRRVCIYCRFEKCLSVGMEPNIIKTNLRRGGRNSRNRFYKNDQSLKEYIGMNFSRLRGLQSNFLDFMFV